MIIKDILYSVIWNRCPKCHNSKVFISGAYNLSSFEKMKTDCPCCGEHYEKEPGFFYGAMYNSYALMVGWFLAAWAIQSYWVQAGTGQFLLFMCISIVAFIPLTFRFSRLLWLNYFIRYNKEACNCKQTQIHQS